MEQLVNDAARNVGERMARQGPRAVAVAVPALVLAAAGVTHPMVLNASTAHHWWTLHVVLLPVFPLLAVVIWALLRGEGGIVAWVGRIAGYVFAVFYTGLDTVTGIAAGVALDTKQASTAAVDRLVEVGNELAVPGIWAYPVAVIITGILSVRRDGPRALPGAVILVAAAPFMLAHIYWPVGVAAMVGTAIGAAALEIARHKSESLEPVGN